MYVQELYFEFIGSHIPNYGEILPNNKRQFVN